MFCKNCGAETPSGSMICTNCGKAITTEDNGGFLWGLLGCCVPIAGLVLFLIWKDTKPKTAKALGIGALVYCGFLVLYLIAVFAFGIFAGVMGY